MASSTIVGVRVNPTDYERATREILAWARSGDGRYACVANVHMIMEAFDDPDYRAVVNAADMVTPDGMPLVWMLRLRGWTRLGRVYGPTLMLHVLKAAEDEEIPVGFYGGTAGVIEALGMRVRAKFPDLKIQYSHSPPFRALSPGEDSEMVEDLRASGVRILFVGLGCPKQEIWMARHRDRVSAAMLGVGAAFDFHAGTKPQAPRWMQNIGLEWMFRLAHEPRRLWRRYLYHNPRFAFLALADLLGVHRG